MAPDTGFGPLVVDGFCGIKGCVHADDVAALPCERACVEPGLGSVGQGVPEGGVGSQKLVFTGVERDVSNPKAGQGLQTTVAQPARAAFDRILSS